MNFARVARTSKVPVCDISRWFAAAVLFGSAFIVPSSAISAAEISYGNFVDPPSGTMFLGVKEGSPTNDPLPLYGPPDPFTVGLDFDPTDEFSAYSNGGGVDLTDGKLNFTIMSPLGVQLVSLYEEGDYALEGVGGPNTKVTAFANIIATVTQVNGVDITPFNLPQVSDTFTDGLPPTVPGGRWSLDLSVDVGAGLGPNQRATKVEIVINNRLGATSEVMSAALIVKKDFRIDVDIPEPATIALAGLAFGALFSIRRREL